ncbi:TetR family transcriptional regulator [Amycolatopsis rifamycinica]|uniref:TetR family transcriptional regulator n=1 Tax=Amycolatopsis rifamycinica TaxID=287986 RepID=A0A066TP42_9PSEU|nr:TetR family transcriptional regulator [Amycolatopsis rifamycinica]KDN16926.1 TetR family transcriptional regulator [Amycolatopsis rifamycinica]
MEKLGLRERKKQRTREALIDAAQELFCANGFEATTVDQIAEAVEVSSRTFFRYFASKEDVALALADEQITAVLAAFAGQPADVPALTALKTAAVEVMRAYEADSRFHGLQDVISVSPALTAARIERATARFDEVARLIGARMGIDPAADPRPHLVASVALCAVQPAVAAWRAAGRRAPDSELTGQAFDLLAAGLDHSAGAEGHGVQE